MRIIYLIRFVLGLCFVTALMGCAPKVYVLDRQTVLETEATGEFPDIEKNLSSRALEFGPKMVDRTKLKQKVMNGREYNILNGELTNESAKN